MNISFFLGYILEIAKGVHSYEGDSESAGHHFGILRNDDSAILENEAYQGTTVSRKTVSLTLDTFDNDTDNESILSRSGRYTLFNIKSGILYFVSKCECFKSTIVC